MRFDDKQVEQAVKDYKAGKNPDENAYLIYRHFYTRVFVHLKRKNIPENNTQDLIQEVFLRVFKNIQKSRDESQFNRWVARIAENVSADYWRRHFADKRDGEMISIETPVNDDGDLNGLTLEGILRDESPESRPDEVLLNKEDKQRMAEAIRRLPPQMRRCLQLCYEQGMSNKEIAEEMGITEGAVKSHLFSARKKVKAYLDDQDGESNP